jgi:hypothetical protein
MKPPSRSVTRVGATTTLTVVRKVSCGNASEAAASTAIADLRMTIVLRTGLGRPAFPESGSSPLAYN